MTALKKEHIAEFEVRVGDINYGGHMGNDRALLLFQDSRIKFLQSMGYSEKDIGENKAIIMAEAHAYFLKEVFLGEKLYASVEVTEKGNAFFDLYYEIFRMPDEQLVIKGSTRQLAYDYEKKRVARLPEAFAESLGAVE